MKARCFSCGHKWNRKEWAKTRAICPKCRSRDVEIVVDQKEAGVEDTMDAHPTDYELLKEGLAIRLQRFAKDHKLRNFLEIVNYLLTMEGY